jgi:DNA-binding IclR family transcriptional regulator
MFSSMTKNKSNVHSTLTKQLSGALYAAPALEKGLDILECLAQGPEGKTLLELSEALGKSSSEIYRMVEVLARRGYITRQDDGFRLSLKMFDLGKQFLPLSDITSIATLHMHELALLTRQSVHLSMHHDKRLVVVISVQTPEPLGFSVRLGSHFPFRTDRTSARVIAAFQPAELQKKWIVELVENAKPTVLNPRLLLKKLNEIRFRGYEQVPSDTVNGITDIAFPIFDASHMGAIASINMPYLKQRDAQMTIAQSRSALKKTAETISIYLGFNLA